MKIKTAFKTILFIVFLSTFSFLALEKLYGQSYPVYSGDVIVTTQIDVDFHSQLSLQPTTVEILQPSIVTILIRTANNVPRPGRSIQLYVEGNPPGITIIQPGLTNAAGQATGTISSSIPGSYVVCAIDTTEVFDITIANCGTLYVIPVPPPVMLPEPEYTRGDRNTVMWNMSGSGVYEFYAQVSTDPDFSTVKDSSGWITNLAHEFTDLRNGQMYFYRVKARNAYGGESAWSNIVYSVQVSEGPEITFISISDMGENTNVTWDRNYAITIRYRITDSVGIAGKDFWCVASNGARYECIYTSVEDGDFWEITIQLKHLEKTPSGNLFERYNFCVEARDLVDNVARNCEAILEVEIEVPEEEIPPPIVSRIPLITRIRERLERTIDDILLRLEEFDLTDITVTTTAANILVGIGLLLTAIGYLPYFLIQLVIAILTLLGFRKKDHVTGYVYDSLTKEPISQAVVRVFTETHELVWTSVTDSNGYFNTPQIDDGEYYIKVVARSHTFPSKVVFGRTDFPLENVYHGDAFLTREEKIPEFSIPMDEKDASTFRKRMGMIYSRTKALWKVLHVFLFLFGLLLSIYAVYITPIWWNYLILGLYVPVLVALLYSRFSRNVRYGVVKDQGGKYVKGAIIGLIDKEHGKLASKRITDRFGRYKFVVNRGSYELSVLNSDLKIEEEEKVADIKVEKTSDVLAPDIKVKRLEDDVEEEELLEPLEDL